MIAKNSRFLFLSMIPLLMSASTVTTTFYSRAYGIALGNDYVEKLVASDVISATALSSRDGKMAEMVFMYDIFLTQKDGLSTIDKPYYDVYFQFKETIFKDVAYANGMFNWFTEHGDVVLEGAEVYCELARSKDAGAYNVFFAPDRGSQGYLNVTDPCINQQYYSPLNRAWSFTRTGTGRVRHSSLPYVSDTTLASEGLIAIDQPKTKYSAIALNPDSSVPSSRFVAQFSHESMPQNGETLTYFGNFGFTPTLDASAVDVKIGFPSTVSIARGNQWGSCIQTGLGEKTVTLENWSK